MGRGGREFIPPDGGPPLHATLSSGCKSIARLTRGAYCRFDPGVAHELGELLRAAAAFAAGGMRAPADLSGRRDAGANKLLQQMR